MATPLIAQVHGYCLAGGTELATACDLVYVAEDAQIGYPPVRLMSSPDMAWHPWLLGWRRAMEAMLTGDSMSGSRPWPPASPTEPSRRPSSTRRCWPSPRGWPRCRPTSKALNKRVVHRAMEGMGMRDAMRATADINALGFHQRSSRAYFRELRGRHEALDARDGQFGDYRTGPGRLKEP